MAKHNNVYPVVDAIGGTSVEAHRAGLERVVQAGGRPISWVSLGAELQRDPPIGPFRRTPIETTAWRW